MVLKKTKRQSKTMSFGRSGGSLNKVTACEENLMCAGMPAEMGGLERWFRARQQR